MMGPAAAFSAMANPEVSQVIVCDVSEAQLQDCITELAGKPGAEKLGVVRLDLNSLKATIELMASFDAIVAALPASISHLAMRAALQVGTPLVDMAIPNEAERAALSDAARGAESCVVLGCGLEPGLTEILACHLAEKLDRVDELHIKCGGIPAEPSPPLGYKIVFGGQQLPLRENDAPIVQDGELTSVARYSGVESISIAGVGVCEAWHEGFMPWLRDLPALRNLRVGTQKTVRWPGYAAKVSVLKEMGLLGTDPIQVDGLNVVPKRMLDTLLYPQVRLGKNEPDIAVLRVEVLGQKAGQYCRLRAEMVDRYDETLGFTAMARTTAFTASIVGQMIAQDELRATGLLHPERVIRGTYFDRLLIELAKYDIKFDFSETLTE
jgi:saccharopine dehydrogenase-like NADP-dependent oxidoreductase